MGNLSTPKTVQKLQTALHAKAKAEAGYRFYALYDKISREAGREMGRRIVSQCGVCQHHHAVTRPSIDNSEYKITAPERGAR